MGIPATALQPWPGSPHALHVAAAHVVSLIAPRFRSSLDVMLNCKFYANSANMRIGFAYQQIRITSAYLHHMRAERSGERFLFTCQASLRSHPSLIRQALRRRTSED